MQISEGQTVNVNCHKCGDTRGRLYYTRKGCNVPFVCFNCGYKGVIKPRLLAERLSGKQFNQSGKLRCEIPNDAVYEYSDWPAVARKFVQNAGLDRDTVMEAGFFFHPYFNRLAMPFYDSEGLQFMNLRALAVDEQFKYVLVKRRGLTHRPFYIPKLGEVLTFQRDIDNLVICEDILSAIRISTIDGCIGMAAMGVALDDTGVMMVKKLKPKKVTVFLDNDNKEVRLAQRKMRSTLTLLLNCSVDIIKTNKDPKEHTQQELKDVLR